MKRILYLSIGIAMILGTSCSNQEETVEAKPITKSKIEITDGKLTPEIMHRLAKVGDPQVSPDGSKILYSVGYTSIEENKTNRELFVMDIDGQNNKQLTFTAQSEGNARWIDGGAKIAYMKGGQIWIMNGDGSGAKQVSNIEGGIGEFKISPDEKQVMYVAEIAVDIKPTDVYPDLPKSSARTIKDLMYRHWDHFVESIPHTYVTAFDRDNIVAGTDILNGAPYELPTLPFSGLEQLAWSPDGKYIAYSCRKLVGKEYAFSTNTDIYLYEIATGNAINLTEGMLGYDTDPIFSPDGKYIAWISMERPGFEADKQRLFIVDVNSREKRELTTKFKYNVESPVWMPDSDGLYFSSLANALKGIYKIDLSGNVERITPEDAWFDFGGVKLAGDRLITTYKCINFPDEIVSVSLADGSFTQLSFENKEILEQIKPSIIEERWITTSDNKKMHTWVVYPPDFDPAKKYPSILLCLGGPQGTLSQGWSYRWNYKLMSSQGYIVILPNRRGTTAFGQEWTDQISGDYIGQNMRDYFSAADELKKEPYVGKMAAVGASYGGYSVFYLAGIHQKRFDAFIAHAGIFNQEQMYMMTEEMWFPHWDNGGAPWDNNPVAKRHYDNSPHKLIQKWDTPILITHGEMDYRVPVEQGMAAFNAAQMMGVPSEMILFPEENHWILKPQNSVHWNRVFFEWLDRWL